MEAIRHGKHLLVEKPLTMDSAAASKIVEAAASANRVLMTGHLFLYAPAVAAMKAHVVSGGIGKLCSITSMRANFGPPNTAVNVLWDLAPHDISILLYLMDEVPSEVLAVGSAFTQSRFVEAAHVVMTFPSGRLAHVHVSWLTPNKTRVMHVIGDHGAILFDDMEMVEKVKFYAAGVDNRTQGGAASSHALQYGPGAITVPALPALEPLRAECEDFVQCILQKREPVSSGRAGLEVVRVLDAAARQLQDHASQPATAGGR